VAWWPGNTDGISFLPTLLGNEKMQRQHEYLYWEFSNIGGQYAVRIGDWKGVRRNVAKIKDAKWEVYNLKEDAAETKDLSDKHPELVRRFMEIERKRTPSHNPRWNFAEFTANE
jgi:arylsulfatase A